MRHPFKVPPLSIPLRVTSPFGPRQLPGEAPAFHAGVDFAAPEGTPVVAPFDGTAHTFSNDRGGNIVSVISDEGWTVNLDHLSAFAFVGPISVSAGSVVGAVGHTGHATGPHLHVELRPPMVNGEKQSLIDPTPFLVGSGAGALVALAAAILAFSA